MPRPLSSISISAATLAAAAALAAAAPISAAARRAVPSASAPVIHETFTPLPCRGDPRRRTTLQLEGCAEHQVLRADTAIDSLARTIYGRLPRSGRPRFVTASRDWLAYRDAECRAAASPVGAGSEAGVVTARCLAAEDGAHVAALRRLLVALSPGG